MGTCANRTLEFCDISLWVALLICCNVTIACGNKPTSFNISSTSLGEESTKIKTDTGVDANKASKSQQDNQNVSSKRKNKVVERTRTLDTFLLPGNKYSKDEFAVPSQPFETSEFSQEIGISKVSNSIKVLEKTAPNANIVINGPVKSTYSHKVAWNNKPVDLYVVIDDSESFAGNPELRIRAKNLIAKLLKNMQGTDWRLYMSGLPGGKDDSLMLSATTIASGNIDQIIDEKVNDILKESAIGDEQTMRGLANLVTKYKAQDRNNAVHAYFIISDAPNCKDNANSNSQSCNLTSNSPDYYRYLFDQTGSVLGLGTYMQQMSLFGAYYRMTNNTNVCSKNDQVEVPTAGQVLKLNSQYAELSFFWQRALFPSTPLTNNPSWVGDICAESENTEFVNTLTNSIKSMAQHRFVLENSFQDFPQNPEYNFAIFDEAGATVENGVYRPQFNPLIILNEGIYANATLSAVGSTQNNYRKLDFLDTFDTEPRDQSVFVTWLDESGTQKSINCRVGVDFSKVTAPCRHDGKNLYFRNYDDLPKLLPNSTALSKNLTVKYERNVAQINSISFNTGESVIMPEQIQLVATTAQSDAKIPEYLISVQDSVVTLKFQANLPAGSYSVKYFDRSHQRFSVNIIHEIDKNRIAPVCYLPDQTASVSGVSIVLNKGSAFPCSIKPNNRTLDIDFLVPLNASTGKRDFKVAYFATVEPKSSFSLTSPPSNNTVMVRRFGKNDLTGIQLSKSDFSLATGTSVQLSSPLQPGEKIIVEYQYLPDLGDGCFKLSGKASGDTNYTVGYGPMGNEVRLDPTQFTVSQVSPGQTKICLNRQILEHGFNIRVSYLSEEAVTETEQ